MKIKLPLILVLTLFFASCDPYDMKLKIVNNTNELIYIDISKTKTFISHPIYLENTSGDTVWNYMIWIKPNDSLMIPAIGNSWEGLVNKECIDSTLTIFVFKDDLLKSTSRDSLIKYQISSSKLYLTIHDLKRLDWRIDYTK